MPRSIRNFSPSRALLIAVAFTGASTVAYALDGQMFSRAALSSAAAQSWSCSSDTGRFDLEIEADGSDVSIETEGYLNHEGNSYSFSIVGSGSAYAAGFDTVLRFENLRYQRTDPLPEGLQWLQIEQFELTISPTGGEGNYTIHGQQQSSEQLTKFHCN